MATPGRLIDHLRNSQSVGLEDLAVLVLDEADRWGRGCGFGGGLWGGGSWGGLARAHHHQKAHPVTKMGAVMGGAVGAGCKLIKSLRFKLIKPCGGGKC